MVTTIEPFPKSFYDMFNRSIQNTIKEVNQMDNAYKKLEKGASKLKKDIVKVEGKDKARDKLVAKGKKAMKGKC